MSVYDKLRKLELSDDTSITLTRSEGVDVFVHNDTALESAIEMTDIVNAFCELIATPGFKPTDQWGNEVLDQYRSDGLLDDYARDFTFADYLQEVTLDNFYDLELFDHSVEQYDYKRGFCPLSATLQVPFQNLRDSTPFLNGWDVIVETEMGTLTIEG